MLRSDAYFIPRVVRQHSFNPSSEPVTDSIRGVVTGISLDSNRLARSIECN